MSSALPVYGSAWTLKSCVLKDAKGPVTIVQHPCCRSTPTVSAFGQALHSSESSQSLRLCLDQPLFISELTCVLELNPEASYPLQSACLIPSSEAILRNCKLCPWGRRHSMCKLLQHAVEGFGRVLHLATLHGELSRTLHSVQHLSRLNIAAPCHA